MAYIVVFRDYLAFGPFSELSLADQFCEIRAKEKKVSVSEYTILDLVHVEVFAHTVARTRTEVVYEFHVEQEGEEKG